MSRIYQIYIRHLFIKSKFRYLRHFFVAIFDFVRITQDEPRGGQVILISSDGVVSSVLHLIIGGTNVAISISWCLGLALSSTDYVYII